MVQEPAQVKKVSLGGAFAYLGVDRVRPSVNEYFGLMASAVSLRSPCPQGKKHGAVITKDGYVVSAGYNGPSRGEPHCDECNLESDSKGKDWRTCPAVHAEENAALNMSRQGSGVKDGEMKIYVTKEPCERCSGILSNLGLANAEIIVADNGIIDTPVARLDLPLFEVVMGAVSRQKTGIAEHGEGSYMELDLLKEMDEELLDVINYAYLQLLKNKKLGRKQ